MESSTILLLPPEVLQLITQYLFSRDVLYLYRTGSLALRSRLCEQGGVRELRLDLDRMLSIVLPLMTRLFTGLHLLKLKSVYERCLCSIKIPSLDLTLLPRSLRTLVLPHENIRQCFQFNIKDILPNLKRLDISYEGLYIDQQFDSDPVPAIEDWPQFPDTLEDLTLPFICSLDHMTVVPKTLKLLDIAFKPELRVARLEQSISFPPNLTTLLLRNPPSFDMLAHLPPTLTKMFVSIDIWIDGDAEAVQQVLPILPRSLEKLNLPVPTICSSVIRSLPSKLSILDFSMVSNEIYPLDVIPLLPRTIEEFDFTRLANQSPESLQDLSLDQASELISSLPRTLKTMPHWMFTLTMHEKCQDLILNLPPTLTYICLGSLHPGWASLLPSTLTYLIVNGLAVAGEDDRFPPKLLKLFANDLRDSTLLALHRSNLNNLQQMYIHVTEELNCTTSAIRFLPASIQQLVVWVGDNCDLDLSIPHWSHFYNLSSLELYKVSGISRELISSLPATITDLGIANVDDARFDLSTISRLRPLGNLISLKITNYTNGARPALILEDEDLSTLPRSLRSFSFVDQEPSQLTPAFLQTLPPKLHDLTIPPSPELDHISLKNLPFLLHTFQNGIQVTNRFQQSQLH